MCYNKLMMEAVAQEVGSVIKVKNYLLTLVGLPSVRINDLIEDEDGRRALVRAINEDTVEALLLDQVSIEPGRQFYLRPAGYRLHPGDHLKGRILNALGDVITDAIGSSAPAGNERVDRGEGEKLAFNVVAQNIKARKLITRQLVTGFGLVDVLIPIGKGQRELIYGSRHSGKTRFLEEVMINQQDQGTTCIYAVIGKPTTFTASLWQTLKANQATDKAIIISAMSDESTPMITIAPATALLLAEHFCRQGEDVLLILDDLGLHAKYLREIALLSGRLPGRESYPGDIFYQHAHLMERGGSFNSKQGNGTISLLPVLETDMEGYTNLIPTNLMACTDGHLFFSSEMETEGYVPAISVAQSVSRIGHSTQTKLSRELATRLMTILSEYPRHQEYSRFGTQLSPESKKILKQGRIIQELLNQNSVGPLPLSLQIVTLALIFTSWFEADDHNLEFLQAVRKSLIDGLQTDKAFAQARELAISDKPALSDLLTELESRLKILEKICQSSKPKKQN